LGVIRVFTEMTVQGILKLSLDNIHIVEILMKMKTQNSIKKKVTSKWAQIYVEKSFSVLCRTVMTKI